MKRIRYTPFVFLVLAMAVLMSLPLTFTEYLRKCCHRLLHSPWQGLTLASSSEQKVIDQLIVENRNLRTHLESLQNWLVSEERLDALSKHYSEISQKGIESDFFRRRSERMRNLLEKQFQSLSGQ